MAMQNYEMWIDLVGDGDAMKVTGSKEQTDAMEALISCTHHFDGVSEMWVPLPGHEDLTPEQRAWYAVARERFGDVTAKEYQVETVGAKIERWQHEDAKRLMTPGANGYIDLTPSQRKWLEDRGYVFEE